jgi:hypothetical protein
MIILMDDVDIPTHQTHLQAENGWVGTVVGKDEFNCITVSSPHKVLAKEHMAALVHCPITGESFTKMRVEHNFIPTTAPGTKSNWMMNSHRIFSHKTEVQTRVVRIHCYGQSSVSSWLANDIAKPL